jgi:ribosomal protein S18 acetylase RimI-like enzyme
MSIKHGNSTHHVASWADANYQRYLFDFGETPTLSPALGRGRLFESVVAGNRAEVVVEDKSWDTDVLRVRTAALSALHGDGSALKAAIAEALIFARDSGIELLTCRIDGQAFAAAEALGVAGFYITDVMAVLLWDRSSDALPRQQSHSAVAVRGGAKISATDRDAAALLTGQALTHGRVWNDARITDHTAQRFGRRLFESLVEQPGSQVFLADVDGRFAGCAIARVDKRLSATLSAPLATLWTIAVDPACRGCGVGQALVSACLESISSQARYFEAATQISNTTALNLYGRMGLRSVAGIMTFHCWPQMGCS